MQTVRRIFAKVITLLYDTPAMTIRRNLLSTTFTRQRLASLAKYPWELVPFLALFYWLYRRTMPPGISSWIVEGWDSAVLQITGSTWGIPHSPGYPLYTILSNLFVRLLGYLPVYSRTEPVWRVTFWSTTTSLLTLAVVYLVVRRLARNRPAALFAAALLGVSFNFWRGAIMAEVYSLNALIFALTFWLALIWDTDRRDRWLVLLGLVLGAGLAHHRTSFILPPTIALWVTIRRPVEASHGPLPHADTPRWKVVARRWSILAAGALVPLLSYLYLPMAARWRAGQSWLYADASNWNVFWFMVLTREWWGLVKPPADAAAWGEALLALFRQQAGEITAAGVVAGLAGLALNRRYLWLFAPPLAAFTFFGLTYHVADLDSMLIPLTLVLSIGVGALVGNLLRRFASRLVKIIRLKDEALRGRWLSVALRGALSVVVVWAGYLALRPLAEQNYPRLDLSGDWQAVDLVEEVVAIAQAGTPLTIIGQDNSVLPDFIYAQVSLKQPVEPLSTTTLSRMPEAQSIALLQERFNQGRRILVDRETIDLGFIPWLNAAINQGRIFLAPTGHPYLWELIPRPMPNVLPPNESWTYLPPGQFLDGKASIIAYSERLIRKRTGCFLRLTLFWRMEEKLDQDYFVSVQPLGGEVVLAKNDHLALMRGYLPTSQVEPGEIVRDEVDLLVLEPSALVGVNLVVNLYQVQGNQYPAFGEVTLPVTPNADACK